MIWGDVVFVLVERVFPASMPLQPQSAAHRHVLRNHDDEHLEPVHPHPHEPLPQRRQRPDANAVRAQNSGSFFHADSAFAVHGGVGIFG